MALRNAIEGEDSDDETGALRTVCRSEDRSSAEVRETIGLEYAHKLFQNREITAEAAIGNSELIALIFTPNRRANTSCLLD